MAMNIKEKVALITGSGQGLGKSIAMALAAHAMRVILVGRTESNLNLVRSDIIRAGGRADVVVMDVSDPNQYAKLDDLMKNPGIDILINNAGWSPPVKIIEEVSDLEIDDCFRINVYASIYMQRKLIPHFKAKNSGIIINISSRAGRSGYPRLSLYSASKFAVEGLTQSVAKELEKTAVTCYAIAPGALNTPMRQQLFGDAEKKQDPMITAGVILKLIRGDLHVPSGTSIDPDAYPSL